MLTFDKVKLVASMDCLLFFDENEFVYDRRISTWKYKRDDIFLLSIDIKPHEVVLEFTGKILGKDYPQLISKETIMKCFEMINSLGMVELDAEKMMAAEVTKCDVTKDVAVEDIPELTRFIKGNIRSFQKYSCKRYAGGNLVIEKLVSTPKLRKRITIYDKQHEMNSHDERPFVSENGLEGQYDGICRFELNLTSKKKIRETLCLTGNTLAEVLQSDTNPIRDYLDEILAEDPACNGIKDLKTYEKYTFLKDCDFDLEKVEAVIRQYKNPRYVSIPKLVNSYRTILAGLPKGTSTWSKKKLLDMVN